MTTALLLIGHGGFDFAMRKDWSGYPAAVGISSTTLDTYPVRFLGGWFECALGLVVLAWPARAFLLFAFVWKITTEALRPLAGEPIWEFIERGGSYGAPLALAWLQNRTSVNKVGGVDCDTRGRRRSGGSSVDRAPGALS